MLQTFKNAVVLKLPLLLTDSFTMPQHSRRHIIHRATANCLICNWMGKASAGENSRSYSRYCTAWQQFYLASRGARAGGLQAPHVCHGVLAGLKAESPKRPSVLAATQTGTVCYSRAADAFVSEGSSPPQHPHHPRLGSRFLLCGKCVSWKKGADTWLLAVLGHKCPSQRSQRHSARFASLQPPPLHSAEPLPLVGFGLPQPLCSLRSQLPSLSFFPCLSPFLFPLGLLSASPLQASCLLSEPALPTAGIPRCGTLIHFVLALGAPKPPDFTGLHKLEAL